MLSYSLYPGLAYGLDLQAEVKSDILQGIIVGSQNAPALQGFGQDIHIGSRERSDVASLSRPLFRRLSCLGRGAFHPDLEDVKQGFSPDVLELRLHRRDGDQLSSGPLAPDEHRSIGYDIHMQRLF